MVEKVNNDRSKNSPNLGPTFSVDYYNINLSLLSQFDHKGGSDCCENVHLPGTLGGEEGVGDVDGVVDAGADADDVADSQVGIDGHPQSGMAEPHHVHQGEQDAAEDEETGEIQCRMSFWGRLLHKKRTSGVLAREREADSSKDSSVSLIVTYSKVNVVKKNIMSIKHICY